MAYVNTNTGEWSRLPPKPESKKKLKVKKYVGIDVPHPSQCKDKESLLESVKNIDCEIYKKVNVDNKYILDSVVKGCLTTKCADSLEWLCNSICAWNFVFTTKSEIIARGFTTKPNYAKWVRDMEVFITVTEIHQNNKEHLRIRINPVVAWKGNDYLRKCAIQVYYTPYTI